MRVHKNGKNPRSLLMIRRKAFWLNRAEQQLFLISRINIFCLSIHYCCFWRKRTDMQRNVGWFHVGRGENNLSTYESFLLSLPSQLKLFKIHRSKWKRMEKSITQIENIFVAINFGYLLAWVTYFHSVCLIC